MVTRGERIREERERLGLKQDQLGVAPKTQRFYESGERSPDAEYLENFALRGADVLYVITGKRVVSDLTADEQVLVTGFRGMDQRGRAGVIAMIAGLTQPAGTTIKIGGSVSQVVEGCATFEKEITFNLPAKKDKKK